MIKFVLHNYVINANYIRRRSDCNFEYVMIMLQTKPMLQCLLKQLSSPPPPPG